jgi:IS30 family transposase
MPKPRRLDADADLRTEVINRLRAARRIRWPARLRYEHPGQRDRWISHEVIYTWIYALLKDEPAGHPAANRAHPAPLPPGAPRRADDQTYLDRVAAEPNNRPRRTPGYRTPEEVFADLLASSNASTG